MPRTGFELRASRLPGPAFYSASATAKIQREGRRTSLWRLGLSVRKAGEASWGDRGGRRSYWESSTVPVAVLTPAGSDAVSRLPERRCREHPAGACVCGEGGPWRSSSASVSGRRHPAFTCSLSSSAAAAAAAAAAAIEKEIARTQKNKATEYHLGLLKAKLAKYRAQLLEPSKSASTKGEGFDVMKSGDARVALIGFPSVGKSTFLSLMTSTASEAASYEFTTLTCIPGVIEYKGANIQLLDLPGIIEGAAQGKGRGRQVIAVARTADVVIMMLDATKGEVQRSLLEKELESVGIRLNKHRPNIYFKPKKGGGISFNSTVTLSQCSEKLVQLILHEYKIFNAEVLFREDCSPDEFIDVIVGNRVYMPCLYVYNKIDQISMEEVDRLARKPNSVVISCGMKLNLDFLLEMLWEYLALTCIYTKKRGQRPDFTDAIILRKGASVEHVCHRIHRTLASQFKYALVWGTSTKYSPQRVGLTHTMEHEDVIQIVKK
ncbi:developmentally-regulated GTP-binding protein 2 [Vombatus ursinus]|nr:developmentally-regulated GTP-binding protein 2 [Vombatus ursinus]